MNHITRRLAQGTALAAIAAGTVLAARRRLTATKRPA